MKKYLLLFLTLIFCICLIGCEMPTTPGGNTGGNTGGNNGGNNSGGTDNPGGDSTLVENPKLNIEYDYPMHEFFEQENPFTELVDMKIYIGYYPQREITDKSMVAKLNSITTLNERGFIEYDGNEFVKVTIVNNHIYGEHPGDDDVYYYSTQYKVGTTHFFLVEPLCWKVLSITENEYFLVTDDIIDTRAFHFVTKIEEIDGVETRPSDYTTSSIRKWLNEEFYDICFTEEEKTWIKESVNEIDSIDILSGKTLEGETIDKVFLLSYKEVTNRNLGFFGVDARRARCSDYARAKGLTNVNSDILASSNWWTRSGFEYTPLFPAMVKYDGTADNPYYPDGVNIGVRPAIKIIYEEK